MRKYTKDQIASLIAALEARYVRCTSCAEARELLDASHALRDRLGAL